MIVGLVSDTHDRMDSARAAVELFARRKAGAIIHAGDMVAPFTGKIFAGCGVPVCAVLGNNDGEKAGLKLLFPGIWYGPIGVKLGGRRFVVIHDLKRMDSAAYGGAEVVVHGHTHDPEIQRAGSLVIINPGEACGWLTGRRTAALLDTSDLSAEIVELG